MWARIFVLVGCAIAGVALLHYIDDPSASDRGLLDTANELEQVRVRYMMVKEDLMKAQESEKITKILSRFQTDVLDGKLEDEARNTPRETEAVAVKIQHLFLDDQMMRQSGHDDGKTAINMLNENHKAQIYQCGTEVPQLVYNKVVEQRDMLDKDVQWIPNLKLDKLKGTVKALYQEMVVRVIQWLQELYKKKIEAASLKQFSEMELYFEATLCVGMLLKESAAVADQNKKIENNFFVKLDLLQEEKGLEIDKKSKPRSVDKFIKFAYKLVDLCIQDADNKFAKEVVKVRDEINDYTKHFPELRPYKDSLPRELAGKVKDLVGGSDAYKKSLEYLLVGFDTFDSVFKKEFNKVSTTKFIWFTCYWQNFQHPEKGKVLKYEEVINFIVGKGGRVRDFTREVFDSQSGLLAWFIVKADDKDQKGFLTDHYKDTKKDLAGWQNAVKFMKDDELAIFIKAANDQHKAVKYVEDAMTVVGGKTEDAYRKLGDTWKGLLADDKKGKMETFWLMATWNDFMNNRKKASIIQNDKLLGGKTVIRRGDFDKDSSIVESIKFTTKGKNDDEMIVFRASLDNGALDCDIEVPSRLVSVLVDQAYFEVNTLKPVANFDIQDHRVLFRSFFRLTPTSLPEPAIIYSRNTAPADQAAKDADIADGRNLMQKLMDISQIEKILQSYFDSGRKFARGRHYDYLSIFEAESNYEEIDKSEKLIWDMIFNSAKNGRLKLSSKDSPLKKTNWDKSYEYANPLTEPYFERMDEVASNLNAVKKVVVQVCLPEGKPQATEDTVFSQDQLDELLGEVENPLHELSRQGIKFGFIRDVPYYLPSTPAIPPAVLGNCAKRTWACSAQCHRTMNFYNYLQSRMDVVGDMIELKSLLGDPNGSFQQRDPQGHLSFVPSHPNDHQKQLLERKLVVKPLMQIRAEEADIWGYVPIPDFDNDLHQFVSMVSVDASVQGSILGASLASRSSVTTDIDEYLHDPRKVADADFIRQFPYKFTDVREIFNKIGKQLYWSYAPTFKELKFAKTEHHQFKLAQDIKILRALWLLSCPVRVPRQEPYVGSSKVSVFKQREKDRASPTPEIGEKDFWEILKNNQADVHEAFLYSKLKLNGDKINLEVHGGGAVAEWSKSGKDFTILHPGFAYNHSLQMFGRILGEFLQKANAVADVTVEFKNREMTLKYKHREHKDAWKGICKIPEDGGWKQLELEDGILKA